MINNVPKLLDIVALSVDLPEHNLRRGEIGTVVELLAGGTAFEVEFSDDDGQTYESIGLRPEEFIILKKTETETIPKTEGLQPIEINLF